MGGAVGKGEEGESNVDGQRNWSPLCANYCKGAPAYLLVDLLNIRSLFNS
jgi:hypothetical protein